MLKIIIVDDEALVRIGIKSCIEWEKYNFEFVGQAEDGLQALELIEKTSPDIVLTDILMPNMDGLELIGQLSARYPLIKVIVLSCHHEMDAVKQAMRLGAEDYILKLSMKPDSLLEVMLKVKAQVEKERLQNEEKINFESVLRSNKQIIKNGLYKKLMSGSITYSDFQKESLIMQVQPDFNHFLVIYCTIDDYYNAPTKSRMRDSHLLSSSFLNILKEGLADFAKIEFVELDGGDYLILLDASVHAASNHQVMTELLGKMNSSLKRYLNITVSFTVSGKTNSLKDIPALFMKAKLASGYRFYEGRESIIFTDGLPEFIDKEIIFGLEEEKLLMEHIRANDYDGVKIVIDRFFNSIVLSATYHPMRVKTAVLNVLYIFMKVLKPYEEQISPSYNDSDMNWTEMILDAETLDDIKGCVDECIASFIQSMLSIKGEAARPEIMSVKRYVYDNIEQNISLEDAAKFSNMSRSYFSYMFKKEMGDSFTNFVNRTKMEKARDLIIKGNLKVYEAAEQVGIRDDAYFSKLFKKYMGVSPGKIKEKGGTYE
ncbi:response regulator transcription factor [Paenibacillus alginolyticus]|uniref:Response regulator n=1 Tax=Paenibacillus alginolyticus TaxID=59839 RepID=A0ABT4GAN7_9BACL|nr:response regulator [Paenibacillus alginolyticus]MCY9693233.1 response regulator [Paenibacillus alginolyticus]MEC0145998.1 response regulator [Paenibacillus alginolyticus]